MGIAFLAAFSGAGAQFFYASGKPLTAGTLSIYYAGTSSPATTYTDGTGAITNANPVVLDGAGRTTTEIWLGSGSSYKFVLKDAAGSTIGTYDNIPGINDYYAMQNQVYNDFANAVDNAKGDALVGFKQAGSSGIAGGAVSRTVSTKLQEMISVKDFGATGNGYTDDSGPIQAAINFVSNSVGNSYGELYFPAGTYRLNNQLVVYAPIYLIGAGPGTSGSPAGQMSTALVWYGNSSPMITFGRAGGPTFSGGGVSRMSLDGRNLAHSCLMVTDTIHGEFTSLGLYRATSACLNITSSYSGTYPMGYHTFTDLNIATTVNGTNACYGIKVDGSTTGGLTTAGVTSCTFDGVYAEVDQAPAIYVGNRGDRFTWTRLKLLGNYLGIFTPVPSIWFAATTTTTAVCYGHTFIGVSAMCGVRFDGPGCNTGTKIINLDQKNVVTSSLLDPNLLVSGKGAQEVEISGWNGDVWGQQTVNGPRNTSLNDGMNFIYWDSTNQYLLTNAGTWKTVRGSTGTITDAGQAGGAISLNTAATSSDYISVFNTATVGSAGISLNDRPKVYGTFNPVAPTGCIQRIGWMDLSTGTPTNGVYIEVNVASSATVRFVCMSGSVATTATSIYTCNGAIVLRFKIEVDPTTYSVNFACAQGLDAFESSVNIATNIPISTLRLSLVSTIVATAAAAKSMFVYDLKYSYQTED